MAGWLCGCLTEYLKSGVICIDFHAYSLTLARLRDEMKEKRKARQMLGISS